LKNASYLRSFRIAVLVLVFAAACGGATPDYVSDTVPPDEDDPRALADREDPEPQAAPAAARSIELPTGVAGTIARAPLVRVLDAGPGRFLAGVEVEPVFADRKFRGWQIVRLAAVDHPAVRSPLADGDVILAVNGQRIAKPAQLQVVWEELRSAGELVIAGERGGQPFELRYLIESGTPGAPIE
jgi:membrane-associated protease RseP (regulator of RpoE activity)